MAGAFGAVAARKPVPATDRARALLRAKVPVLHAGAKFTNPRDTEVA